MNFAVFLKELAQIRREEKEKRRRRLENINSLKGMGYSTHAAKQALHQASGNLDAALKVTPVPEGLLGCPEQPLFSAQAPLPPVLHLSSSPVAFPLHGAPLLWAPHSWFGSEGQYCLVLEPRDRDSMMGLISPLPLAGSL